MIKKASNIEASLIKLVDQTDISKSNELKWKKTDRVLYNNYLETKELALYKDLIEGEPQNILYFILKLYYDCKTLDPINKNLYDCICNLVKTIEYGTDIIEKQEFMAKLDALNDFIKEYEIE